MECKYHVISGDSLKTELMQCFDTFEKSKVLGEFKTMSITLDTIDLDLLTDKLIQAYTHVKQRVSFLHIISADDQPMDYNKIYFDPTVRVISNGRSWYVLSDALKQLGYEVITDEHKFIKSITK